MRLNQIQEQIGRGEYQVDPNAVAEAILRRLLQLEKEGSSKNNGSQGECS